MSAAVEGFSSSATTVVAANADVASGAPIFLTGFSRSGTTWVNELFRQYFNAGFVNEGQFIIAFGRRLSRYGDITNVKHRQTLIRDLRRDEFFSILQRNYTVNVDWKRVGACQPTFAAIVLDILTQIAEKTGKLRIGSKYPAFGRHLTLLNLLFPDCRVVHVIRDGRDCALSQKRVVWGHQNAYTAAVHWCGYLSKAREGAQCMPGRYLEVRYEDLLAKPLPSMARLEEFVTGAPAGPATERFMRDAQKLRTGKIEGWRRSMSPRDQAIFEGVAAREMRQHGYALTGTCHFPSILARGMYIAHDRISREAWHLARMMFSGISEYK